jgi:hypothetical protein
MIVRCSCQLVSSINGLVEANPSLSQEWVGLILLPIVGRSVAWPSVEIEADMIGTSATGRKCCRKSLSSLDSLLNCVI